jgi:hypothetical protein
VQARGHAQAGQGGGAGQHGALIRRISGSQLIVNLTHGELPADLRHLVTHPEARTARSTACASTNTLKSNKS